MKVCGERCHGYICTKKPGHRGRHVAKTESGERVASWVMKKNLDPRK